ncbi:flagellar filament capping protein FliD [Vibrio aestuarianus]|uniref:Flagellar hook-associated protein 2 n=1 Tax=Vibrio aestuarianus TaxID=28171 RepID=A0A0A1E7B7_9VIBR|nr:flagellar filament capping protein FliD [Vibrio aestuarianus]AIY26265.1 flagellar hook-associated protein 2 [Vibrio aestuarianus subsp. francensis]MDE1213901.1 flagellar filament capping protein FliD [Vibrio aestuarianus]MDE1216283.1 flagellar filament capping protein FliD [Vibrio aestuarianus]MDE1227586.1 flagellar filament capping protein FliD [Vibrio aestuarianus]MDE1256057.1 flagellar filament capping protein FliD [Vibrio aestuarianus]
MSLGPMGMNTGMDINSLVSKIVNAERVPKQQRIDNELGQIDASISAYGRLKESLDTMKNLMTNFRQEKAFALRKVDTTDENIVSATATTDAIAGKYAIDVLQLAQSHKVASDVLDKDAKFGPGKLLISLGNKTFDIDVQANSKLIDIVRGINGSKTNPGVRAAIINDVEGPRLIVASNLSGKDNAIKINAQSETGNPLKNLEYKTLEERVKDLEKARSAAQQLISPLTPDQQKIAARVAEKIGEAAREVDQSMVNEVQQAAGIADDSVGELPDSAVKTAAAVGVAANKYLKPSERIPGWTETASGTLLDSYYEPEPELDAKALEKSADVPGWSNTASGTLVDSYVTPKEAQAKLEQQLSAEKSAIAKAIQSGEISPEQAKQMERAKLDPEERAYLEKVDQVEADLKAAQDSFDAYQGMIQVQASQDSMVVLDGVATLSSNNNVIEDAIEGVDLTLKGKSPQGKAPAEIGVEYDRQSVRNDIEQFVAAYNQFHQVSQDLAGVDPRTGQAGPLAGDSIVRSADSRLRTVFSTKIEQAPEEIKSLTEFGITTTRQGTLEINYSMLDRQLNNNFNKLGDFFGGNQGFAKRVEDAIQSMTGVTGSIRTREKSLVERNYRIADDQAALDRRMDSLEKRTHSKFSAMQDATSKMQNQLAGMMNALGG